MSPQIEKLHFANFFQIFDDPATEILEKELALTPINPSQPDKLRLVYKDEDSVLHYIEGTDSLDFLSSPVMNTYGQTEKERAINTLGIENDTFSKLSNPSTLPTGNGRGISFSSDNIYLAIAHNNSPYITIYKRNGNIFTKLGDPIVLPTGQALGVSFSPDDIYLAIAHSGSPYITIYKRDGDTFTKLTNPTTLPTGIGNGVSFSSDSVYLAITHDTSPYITIYKRTGDIFTKLTNPTTLPTGQGLGVSFSSDDVYLAIGHDISPYITIYKRTGDIFTKLNNPNIVPTGLGWGISFSPDNTYLAIAHNNSPYITIYKRNEDTFTKLSNPIILPTGQGVGISFSSDNMYLVISHATSPFITVYKRGEDTFTKLADPDTLPTGTGYGISFSSDNNYLVITHNTSPYLTIYDATLSGEVNLDNLIPNTIKIEATGINERQVLIQYDKDDKVKDILVLPEYFCKLGSNADIFDVNSGIIKEIIQKNKIIVQPTRTELINNAIFKVIEVNNTDIDTSFNYPVTTEANKDSVAYRNNIYRGADGFLYIIKDIAVTELVLPFWTFNTRTAVKDVKVDTTFFLLDQTDKFSLKTYRFHTGIVSATSIEIIGAAEDYIITEILKSNRLIDSGLTNDKLTISADLKSLEGITANEYYDIVVTTNEVKLHPTLSYDILDLPKGFFDYLYKMLKNISNNSSGVGGASIGGSISKKYIFEYTFTAITEDITSFDLPEELFNPVNNDNVMLIYKGLYLEKDVDYTREENSRTVNLNFTLDMGDKINTFIFKYIGTGEEINIVSNLQTYINGLNARIGSLETYYNSKKIYEHTFTATESGITSFDLPSDKFNIENGDFELLSIKGAVMKSGLHYTRAIDSLTINLTFPLELDEKIEVLIFKRAMP